MDIDKAAAPPVLDAEDGHRGVSCPAQDHREPGRMLALEGAVDGVRPARTSFGRATRRSEASWTVIQLPVVLAGQLMRERRMHCGVRELDDPRAVLLVFGISCLGQAISRRTGPAPSPESATHGVLPRPRETLAGTRRSSKGRRSSAAPAWVASSTAGDVAPTIWQR